MSVECRILVVEDDELLIEALREQFELHAEFELTFARSAAATLDLVAQAEFDLILLDVGLPDQDGRETCKILRRQKVTAPIIMLTGAATEADTILGLDAGANDYVTKPFRFGVLLARIRAHLRQFETSDAAILQFGPYEFRPAMKQLMTQSGDKIRLTEKETNILKFLYRASAATVSRETLLHEIWGYNAQITTHTLETHIYRLRQKIEADPSNAKLLVTEEGGYRLVTASG
ncbi:MAG: DNA-binding response regulator [Rhizobiales bacterium TMED83]|jgi:DNA-binding response OmpR family regulator|nr:DNA-binding response regulator [Rhodobiaceae bacterium]RPF94114.1 MAG: DNA-binding response regulator [Rhizobiales bacterium TMED83]